MGSRSSKGSTSSSRKPVNDAAVTVARSDPDPFTHSTRVGRPRRSGSTVFDEVLPPPQLHTARSAPSLFERATSASRTGVPARASIENLYRPLAGDLARDRSDRAAPD